MLRIPTLNWSTVLEWQQELECTESFFCAFWCGCCLTNTRPNAPQPGDIMILCGSVEELHSITGRSVVIVMMVAAGISV